MSTRTLGALIGLMLGASVASADAITAPQLVSYSASPINLDEGATSLPQTRHKNMIRISHHESQVLRGYYAPSVSETKITQTTMILPAGMSAQTQQTKKPQHLARGEVLDTSVGQPLPAYLQQRLPTQPAGTVLLKVENKVVRVNSHNQTIMDVIEL